MKNKLGDLNDHLFAQLERLGDESLSLEDIQKEVTRAGAIVKVADQIVGNANVQLRAVQLSAEYGNLIAVPLLALEKRPK